MSQRNSWRSLRLALLVAFTTVVVAACATATPQASPAAPATPQVIEKQVTVEATVPVTVVSTVPVVVTATPAPTAAPKAGGTLIVGVASDAKGLDPHLQTAFTSFRVLELMYDPLLAFDKDMKVIPNLAQSYSWSADGKTLTMNLRQNVKFHNGDPMTSADVKFTFQRILDEKTGAAGRSFFTAISSIDTPDPNTVVFTLSDPNSAIVAAMTNPNSAIIDQKAVTGGADPAKVDVGTGAFKLVNWDPDHTLTLAANKDFWIPGEPYLDGIEFRVIPDESSILAALRAKQIDWAIINDPRVAIVAGSAGSSLVVDRTPALDYNVLQLNANHPVFQDVRVRQAVSCAIDRQQVLDTAALGEGQVTGPATAPFYRASLSDLACYTQDVNKAKQLLSDAGKSTGVKFTIIAATDEPPTATAEAQNIQAQLKQVGIETDIQTLELGVYVQRWLKADFDAAVALNGGNPDPDIMLYRYWDSTGNLQGVANYHTDAIDQLLTQGRATSDPTQRKTIYDNIQKQLVEAAPWVWLYVGYQYRVHQPYVQGFTLIANGSDMYLREAWLNK